MEWTLHFEDSAVKGRVKLESTPRAVRSTTEAKFEATAKILERMDRVFSATNYSLRLRNSEHLARYIMEGEWQSLQMQRGSPMRGYFAEILEKKHRFLLASLPSDLLERVILGSRPPPPPRPKSASSPERKGTVLYDLKGVQEHGDDLKLKFGEEVSEVTPDDNGLTLVKTSKGVQGKVPTDSIQWKTKGDCQLVLSNFTTVQIKEYNKIGV